MPVPGSRPPEQPYGVYSPRGFLYAMTAAAALSVVSIVAFACAPRSTAVAEAIHQEAPARMNEYGEGKVEIYNDPGGCQYLVFWQESGQVRGVTPRMAPNTNGICKAAQ
jgi:hypothetical protein